VARSPAAPCSASPATAPSPSASRAPIGAVAGSAVIGLVCEAVGDRILLFHVASGRFTREIQCPAPVKFLFIHEASPAVVAVGEDFAAVFSVNGSRIVLTEGRGTPVTAACVSETEQPVVATAQSKPAVSSSLMRLWTVPPVGNLLEEITALRDAMAGDLALGIALKLAGENIVLFVLEEKGAAQTIALGCEGCGKHGLVYHKCRTCHEDVCDDCLAREENRKKKQAGKPRHRLSCKEKEKRA
jgi:hypothetical protein